MAPWPTGWGVYAMFYFILPYIKTHWGRVTHICVGKLTIIGSDNDLSPERRQAIIWTNAGILLIGPLGTNFSEILIEIQTFSLKKIRLKMSSAKCYSFRLGLNVLNPQHSFNSGHTSIFCLIHFYVRLRDNVVLDWMCVSYCFSNTYYDRMFLKTLACFRMSDVWFIRLWRLSCVKKMNWIVDYLISSWKSFRS